MATPQQRGGGWIKCVGGGGANLVQNIDDEEKKNESGECGQKIHPPRNCLQIYMCITYI